MFVDYSIPLNGILTAEDYLNQAAGRIASTAASAKLPSCYDPVDSFSLTDLAAEMIELNQAKTTIKANLQVISTQQELEHEVLDLFA